MAAYSHYLDATVIVQYRLGEVVLSASGVFVGDSGRSIFLEQHLEQHGRQKYFRWEIPYGHIHSIHMRGEVEPQSGTPAAPKEAKPQARAAAASAGDARAGSSPLMPLARPPETA